MFAEQKAYGQDPTLIRRSKTKFTEPLKWKEPARVFTCSWSDFFIDVADPWRAEAWDIIRRTPHLTYQILTKRPERIPECLPADWGGGYANVQLGVSVESEPYLWRIPALLEIPAWLHWISAEPLLGPISVMRWLVPEMGVHWGEPDLPPSQRRQPTREAVVAMSQLGRVVAAKEGRRFLDWVVIGGESGPDARPFALAWARQLVQECAVAGVPVFVKQLGANATDQQARVRTYERKGGDVAEFPEDLQVREFPQQAVV